MTTITPTADISYRFPGFGKLLATRVALDLKQFFRERDNMIWIFAFPIVFLALFSVIFSAEEVIQTHGSTQIVSFATIMAPGMIAQGTLLASFTNLASSLAYDRELGTLKRLSATPLSPISFFAGKIAMVLIVTLIQTAILLAVGVIALGLQLPTGASAWLNFAWLLLLGTAVGSICGIAFSSIPRTAKAAANIASGIVTLLGFISGVFIVGTNLPTWLVRISEVFPLYWLASGLRATFIPNYSFTGTPRLGLGAIVLALWFILGAITAVKTFRWHKK
jgi:ABC-2 type transport system permease protein